MSDFLEETPLLDYNHVEIQTLLEQRQWHKLDEYEKIGAIYNFVQNEIIFGYNSSDEIPSSAVLKDGYGQCNTKGTLFMALLRAVGIACRFHGFTIEKELQKGAITGIAYLMAPNSIIHSWVEIKYQQQWLNLEGFILDKKYLENVQAKFPKISGCFSGFGIATLDFKKPNIDWNGSDTYIQKEGINHDFGIYNDPDSFYKENGSNLTGLKFFLYKHIIRKMINSNVSKIRLQN